MSLKTCQILVFNLALHGLGSNEFWRMLFRVYEDRLMQGPFKQGAYHIFSLIGFLIRSTYTINQSHHDTEQFEKELQAFIEKYKKYNKRHNRLESVPMHKYQGIPKLYEEARIPWRNDPNRFKHKEYVNVINEVTKVFKE